MDADAREDLVDLERLRDVVSAASLECLDLVRRRAERGQEDDRDLAELFALLETGADLVTVHLGHGDVEEDDLWRVAPRGEQRVTSVRHGPHLVRVLAQHAREQLQVLERVIHDENARASGRCGHRIPPLLAPRRSRRRRGLAAMMTAYATSRQLAASPARSRVPAPFARRARRLRRSCLHFNPGASLVQSKLPYAALDVGRPRRGDGGARRARDRTRPGGARRRGSPLGGRPRGPRGRAPTRRRRVVARERPGYAVDRGREPDRSVRRRRPVCRGRGCARADGGAPRSLRGAARGEPRGHLDRGARRLRQRVGLERGAARRRSAVRRRRAPSVEGRTGDIHLHLEASRSSPSQRRSPPAPRAQVRRRRRSWPSARARSSQRSRAGRANPPRSRATSSAFGTVASSSCRPSSSASPRLQRTTTATSARAPQPRVAMPSAKGSTTGRARRTACSRSPARSPEPTGASPSRSTSRRPSPCSVSASALAASWASRFGSASSAWRTAWRARSAQRSRPSRRACPLAMSRSSTRRTTPSSSSTKRAASSKRTDAPRSSTRGLGGRSSA